MMRYISSVSLFLLVFYIGFSYILASKALILRIKITRMKKIFFKNNESTYDFPIFLDEYN